MNAEATANALASMYPAYRFLFRLDRHGQGWWWAMRRHRGEPNDSFQMIGRDTSEALSLALSRQLWNSHVRRAPM